MELKQCIIFYQKNINYPIAAQKAKIKGKVYTKFVVEADGSITNIQILKGLGFDEEAIRVIKAMPKWKPAMQGGKAVKSNYTLPIKFELE